MTRPPPRSAGPDRALVGVGLLAFLGVLAYSAHRSNTRFTVIAEIVSAIILVSGVSLSWWRRSRADRPEPGKD